MKNEKKLSATIYCSFVAPRELVERAKNYATVERRTLSRMIGILLEEALDFRKAGLQRTTSSK